MTNFLLVEFVTIFDSVQILIFGEWRAEQVGVSEFMTEEFSQLNLKEASKGVYFGHFFSLLGFEIFWQLFTFAREMKVKKSPKQLF